MTRQILSGLGVLSVVAAIAIVLAPPDARASVVRVALLAVGTIAAWLLLGRASVTTGSTPERFEAELRRPPAGLAEVPSLRSIDTSVRMATASAFGVEFMLKPMLRELVAWRLARERNLSLEMNPLLARDVMGERLWRVLHVEDPTRDHGAPGMHLTEIQACIDDLERI